MSNFLENRHPQWEQQRDRWDYSWDHYTGEYASHDRIDLYEVYRTGKKSKTFFDKYLHRKIQAETEEAYFERIATSDPVMLFPTAVDSINGISYSADEETVREWGDLGDIEEKGSTAYNLWHDADGKGTNWLPLMKRMGIKQSVLHRVWGLVDGIPEGGTIAEASVHIINPQAVVDWFPTNNPTQVLVKESADMRSDITSTNADRNKETYMLYTLEGWKRYINDEGSPKVIAEGVYEFYTDASKQQRMLPIFPVEIPMPRNLGYTLAMKQNHYYNAKSIRDFSVRNMSFAFLQVVADKGQFDEIMENVKQGFRVLRKDPDGQGEHGYKSPDSSYLAEAGNILEENKKEFMESAFKSYGDAARQVTATEIRQESRSGVEAFLNLLVTSLDEFENNCFWLLEQIYFPNDSSRWGKAFVKRNTDFTPKDVDEALEKASNTILNLDRSKAISTEQKVRIAHPGWDDDEIKAEVEKINNEKGAVEVPFNMVGG